MGKTKKYALWAVAAAVITGAANIGNGSAAIQLILAGFVVWAAWRGFVFLSLLLRPARAYVDPLNRHVDETLRRSGVGAIADAGARLQAGLDGAVDATQRGIDSRR